MSNHELRRAALPAQLYSSFAICYAHISAVMLAWVGKLRSLPHSSSPSRCLSVRRCPSGQVIRSRSYARIALFGDTHFQDRGLDRIVKSSEWIVDEVLNRNCDAVVCLGDVLNTRELVSVRALSAALSFFDRFASHLQGKPLHILLGNHDINLKHSRRYSSLDALSMQTMDGSGLTLHRELCSINALVPGTNVIMLPYHEDQTDIAQFLDDYAKNNADAGETLVFGHLAVAGAQQNHSPYRYRGPLKTSSFAPFKRTFSGHFHHHHELPKHRVVYVGSPMQFNFGDAGDTRGIVIYDTDTDTYELVANPFGEQYIKKTDVQLQSQLSSLFSQTRLQHLKEPSFNHLLDHDHVPDNPFKDKFVQVQMESSDLSSDTFEQLRDSLLRLGASGIAKSTQGLQSLIREHQQESTPESQRAFKHFGTSTVEDIESIIVNFAKSVRKAHLASLNATPAAPIHQEELQDYLPPSPATTAPSSDQISSITSSSRKFKSPKLERKATKKEALSEVNELGEMVGGNGRTLRRRQTLVQQQSLHFLEDNEQFHKLVELGRSLALRSTPAAPSSPSSHSTFKARLHSLYLKSFMGVQGELTIPFFQMNSGIWLIEGANGVGKSTLFEALVWAQFGEFLRSGMQKDYAINDNAKSCTVRLIYENGLVIERSRRRGRTESLRTFQLKHSPQLDDLTESITIAPDATTLQHQSEEGETIMKEEGEETLDEPLSTFSAADVEQEGSSMDEVVEDSSDVPSKSQKRSKKKSNRSTAKVGHPSYKSSLKMQYEAERELGDIRNTQKHLCDRLGVNFDTFTKSVVLGQNILSNFVSGNKDMRRLIIEEMLGLEKFNDWLELAKKERAQLDSDLNLLLQKKRMLDSDIHNMSTSSDAKYVAMQVKRAQLQALYDKRDQIDSSSRLRVSSLESDLESARSELNSPNMRALVSEVAQDSKAEVSTMDTHKFSAIVHFESEVSQLLQHLEAARGTDSSGVAMCASCGQEVSQDHIATMVGKANVLVREGLALLPLNFDLDSTVGVNSIEENNSYDAEERLKRIVGLSRSYKQDLERRAQWLARLQVVELSVSRLETSLAQAKTIGTEELSIVSRECIACEVELEQLQVSRDENHEGMTSLLHTIDTTQKEIDTTKVQLSMTKFWEMAFDKQSKGTVGTVRAFVFEDVIAELNAVCNSYMGQLQAKHQYHLKVTLSADLEMEQVYGKRSGGERKRTDLAFLFAMFELVRSQSRYIPDFLMLDEVFDALDQDGRDLVGQVLSSLSKRLEKILVITHTDVASGLSVAGVLDVHMPFDSSGIALGTEVDITHR